MHPQFLLKTSLRYLVYEVKPKNPTVVGLFAVKLTETLYEVKTINMTKLDQFCHIYVLSIFNLHNLFFIYC